MESAEYREVEERRRRLPGWLKVTAITAASVLAGGLAATWIHRKSIARLQNTEDSPEYSNFSNSGREAGDDD